MNRERPTIRFPDDLPPPRVCCHYCGRHEAMRFAEPTDCPAYVLPDGALRRYPVCTRCIRIGVFFTLPDDADAVDAQVLAQMQQSQENMTAAILRGNLDPLNVMRRLPR